MNEDGFLYSKLYDVEHCEENNNFRILLNAVMNKRLPARVPAIRLLSLRARSRAPSCSRSLTFSL